MGSTCNVCGIHATEGQLFAVEMIPFRGGRLYCPNCHARLTRRFFQAGIILDVTLGLLGLTLLLIDPSSRFGHCALNLFLIQLFLVVATLPHELAHAWVARRCGLRVVKVLLGFGPPLWSGRMCGFDVELKQIPVGGHTQVEASGATTHLWPHFLHHLAGPLGSLVLGIAAWAAAGGTNAGALNLIAWTSPWLLFSIACSTLVGHHLFPYVKTTSAGRIPSDGLAMLQILFQRRPPSVAPVKAAPNVREVNFARKFSRHFGVSVLTAGALVCLMCAAMVGRSAPASPSGMILWMAAALFATLGVTFGWGALWTYRKPWQSQAAHGLIALTRHGELTRAFRMEVMARSFWPPEMNYDQALDRIDSARQSGDFVGALAFLDDSIRWAPDNVALQGWRGIALGWNGQHAEAVVQFSSLLEIGDLGLSLRATFLAEHIKALLRAGQRQPAWVHCSEYLDEPGLVPEKLYLLDTIAALAVEEGLEHLLPDAEHWNSQALAMQPENLSLKATRGAVLVEQGRFDEATPLLAEVHTRSEIEVDKGLAAYCLARCALRKGDAQAAARFARQARLLHPAPWLLKRIESEFLPKAA